MNEYVKCYYNNCYHMACFISYKKDSFYYTTNIDKYTVYILSDNGSIEQYNGSQYARDFHAQQGGIYVIGWDRARQQVYRC